MTENKVKETVESRNRLQTKGNVIKKSKGTMENNISYFPRNQENSQRITKKKLWRALIAYLLKLSQKIKSHGDSKIIGLCGETCSPKS